MNGTEPEAPSEATPSGIGAELDRLMKGYRGRIPASTPDEDKAAWREHLEEKYLREGHSDTHAVLRSEARVYLQEMQEQLKQIRNAPLPDDQDTPKVSEELTERIEAFQIRDEIKRPDNGRL